MNHEELSQTFTIPATHVKFIIFPKKKKKIDACHAERRKSDAEKQ